MPPRPKSWWGDGPPPHERWGAGVTIEIKTTWREKRWETTDGRYYFDATAADYAAGFFPTMLRHHIGEFDGKPFKLLPYQRYLVRTGHGWKRTIDGMRRFSRIFCAVPKKNGKSPLASGEGLFLVGFDGEPGAEVYAAAADRDQARIVFDTSKTMVERSPDLLQVFEAFTNSIKRRDSVEYFQVLSADVGTKHGLRPHGIVFDELHAQPNRDLYETLHRGTANRRQPMTWAFTTAGDDDESFCFEEWEYARRLIKGEIEDDSLLPMIFEAGPDEDCLDLAVLRRVNPGFGVTIKQEYLEREINSARNEPRKLNSFMQLHANRWVTSAACWVPIDRWDACDAPMPADEYLAKLQCTAGLDMAQKIDLSAFVVTFREYLQDAISVEVVDQDEITGKTEKRTVTLNYLLYAVPFFWIPEETVIDREREGFTSYREWNRLGQLTITEGAMIDIERIVRDISSKILPRFPLLKQGPIGYDPAFATDIAIKLKERLGLTTFEVLQNYKHLSEPCHALEALIKARRVIHGGNHMLRWCMENIGVKTDDAGRIRPVRPKVRSRVNKKIDGAVAMIMGEKALAALPEPPPPQSYRVEWV